MKALYELQVYLCLENFWYTLSGIIIIGLYGFYKINKNHQKKMAKIRNESKERLKIMNKNLLHAE